MITNEELWVNNSVELTAGQLVDFEEKIHNENSGDWLYIFRTCT